MVSKRVEETEESLEALIKCMPDRFKVYRNKNGTLFEVYDLQNYRLWCKKKINHKWYWMCFK